MDEQTEQSIAAASDEGSLSEHEQAFAPGAERPAAEPVAAEPAADDKKPRHRAKSQEASVEDVPRIAALTRRAKEAEERAEAAERRAAERERPAAREPERRDERPAPAKPRFPTFDEYIAIKGNEEADWYAYDDAKKDWHYDQRRAAERADDARAAEERTIQGHLDAYQTKIEDVRKAHPDFDDVMGPDAPRIACSKVIERAALEIGPAAAYYLATHPDELAELNHETAVAVDAPGFAAAVAGVRRYLKSLVAGEQRSSPPSRTAAGSTGAALALVTPSAPKPPTSVRTSALRSEALPGDESSLDEHERAFSRDKKRA